jgi:hypothetical protein
LLVEAYLALHATSTAVAISAVTARITARIEENLFRILRFISCKHTATLPGT